MKKPKWVVEKEQARKAAASETVWLFGLHAVRDALMNPKRQKLRLIVTRNARDKLAEAIDFAGTEAEMVDPRKFNAPIDQGSVHQGAALEVKPLEWGGLAENCIGREHPRVILLDRVTDPHNVGAILRSAEVLGASAVIGTRHHSAPETGALAKTASGALERQPYLRVRNLADAIVELQGMGFLVLGLDGEAEDTIEASIGDHRDRPVALVLGAEGPGLRQKTKETVDKLVKIDAAGGFGSLNVSNAAAIALYASRYTGQERVISGPSKIATCCYCGTRAALVLKGKQRHELSCSSCGAPLHDLKMLPKRKVIESAPRKHAVSHTAPPKSKRKKKKKTLFSRVMDEAWDVIEDIFD